MADQEFILAPPTAKVGFTILPVDGVLNNMALMLQSEELSGLSEWVTSTWRSLSDERRHTHRLLFNVLYRGFEYEHSPADFPAYLALVKSETAEGIRNRIMNAYAEKCLDYGVDTEIDAERLQHDKDYFIDVLSSTMGKHYEKKGHEMDLSLFAAGHDLLQQPDELRETIIEHITFMWETYLKADWERNLPVLKESIEAFGNLDFGGTTALEAARIVTGRDLTNYWEGLDSAEHVIFVPSAHIGPYNSYFKEDDKVYVIYRARMPEGTRAKSPALSRSELMVHLNALADDTRLAILELLTRHRELCAQDIMQMFDPPLSQSSASRHLRQLTATGYLTERRREVAKCYSLNQNRLDVTIDALKHYLRERA